MLKFNISFNIAKNPKYDGYQRGIAFMAYKSFDIKSAGSGIGSSNNDSNENNNNEIKKNIQLAKRITQTNY